MGEIFTSAIKRKNLYLVHSIDLYYVYIFTLCVCLEKELNCPHENPTKAYSFDSLDEAEYFIERYQLRHKFGKVEVTQERYPEIDAVRMRRKEQEVVIL